MFKNSTVCAGPSAMPRKQCVPTPRRLVPSCAECRSKYAETGVGRRRAGGLVWLWGGGVMKSNRHFPFKVEEACVWLQESRFV